MKKIILPLFVMIFVCISCKNKQNIKGNWVVFKVKMWNSYGTQVLYLDNAINNVTISGLDSTEVAKFSSSYKDTLLQISRRCYLHLKPDSTFQLNDQGMLTQVLSDSDWQGSNTGIWNVDKEKKILNLTQYNYNKKRYKIINLTKDQLVLGELSEDSATTITEITMQK